MPAIRERLITAEELPQLEIEGPYELVEGRIVRLSPTGIPHFLVSVRVNEIVTVHVRRKRLGGVGGAEAGFWVRRSPDSVRAPDLAFVSKRTLAAIRRATTTFVDRAPDLPIEILSPRNTKPYMAKKVREFLRAGAKAVWIFDPKTHTIRVHAPRQRVRLLREGATLEGGDALPGFKAPVAAFFQDLPPLRRKATGRGRARPGAGR